MIKKIIFTNCFTDSILHEIDKLEEIVCYLTANAYDDIILPGGISGSIKRKRWDMMQNICFIQILLDMDVFDEVKDVAGEAPSESENKWNITN